MPSTQVACVGQYQGCSFRIWELLPDCGVSPSTAAAKAYVGAGLATASMTAEIKEGTEVEAPSACGAIAYTVKDVDRIKGWNLTLELILWDYELLESAVGGTLLQAGAGAPTGWNGKTIGWAAPGPDSTDQPAVCLELWTRTATQVGACSAADADTPLFIRHIFPKTTLQLADRNFEDGSGAYMKFTGFCAANPKIWGSLASLEEADDGEGWFGPASTTELEGATYAQIYSNNLPEAPDDSCSFVEYDLS